MRKKMTKFRWWVMGASVALVAGVVLVVSLGAGGSVSVPVVPVVAKVTPTPFYTVPAPSAGASTLTVAPLPPEAFNPGGSDNEGR